jgi:hypothetical protein
VSSPASANRNLDVESRAVLRAEGTGYILLVLVVATYLSGFLRARDGLKISVSGVSFLSDPGKL